MYLSIAWAFKDDGGKDLSTWQKRLSKKEFLALPKQKQKRYIKAFPHSSHRFLLSERDRAAEDSKVSTSDMKKTFGGGPKKSSRDAVINDETSHDPVGEMRAKQAESRAVKAEIADINKANVGVINPASLKAMNAINDGHLRTASDNIRKNKDEIVSALSEQVKHQPKMYGKGLDTAERLISGETEADDLKIVERHALHRSLVGIATLAILGAGVLAASAAAAPLGVLAGTVLINMWGRRAGGKNLRDDLNTLRSARERKRKEKTQQELEDMGHSKRNAGKIAHRVHAPKPLKREDFDSDADFSLANKKRREVVAERKAKQREEEFEYQAAASSLDEHAHTIDVIVDQLADILQYHSARDFKTDGQEMFQGTASNGADPELNRFLTFARAFEVTPMRKGVEFEYGGNFKSLRRFLNNMEFVATASSYEGQRAYHYQSENAHITIAPVAKNRYYMVYSGDLFPEGVKC